MPAAMQSERAVTVLATRRVRDGAQPQFEDFLQRLPDVFASVTGFLGLTVLPPGAPSREYVLIYRFDRLLSTCGIHPIITAISLVAGPLLERLPLLAGFAIVVPLLSAIMTWLVMPGLSKLLAPLLYRR